MMPPNMTQGISEEVVNEINSLPKRERRLLDRIMNSMQNIAMSSSLGNAEAKVRNEIWKLPESAKDPTRVAAVQFLMLFHTVKMQQLGLTKGNEPIRLNDKDIQDFKRNQRKDMSRCWDMLKRPAKAGQVRNNVLVLKVDIAQRLEDPVRISQVFEEVIKGGVSKMSMDYAMIAFTAAPMIGAWPEFFAIGERIMKEHGQSLETFHQMAQQMPIPDFKAIYELAEQEKLQQRPRPDASQVQWRSFQATRIRVKFQSVSCEQFEEKAEDIRKEINKESTDWEDVPNPSSVQIKYMGDIVQSVSFGEIPMQIAGPRFDDKLLLHGQTELVQPKDPDAPAPDFNDPGVLDDPNVMNNIRIIIQKEKWNLARVDDKDLKPMESKLLEQDESLLQDAPEEKEDLTTEIVTDIDGLTLE